jgi:hypothetical protein
VSICVGRCADVCGVVQGCVWRWEGAAWVCVEVCTSVGGVWRYVEMCRVLGGMWVCAGVWTGMRV